MKKLGKRLLSFLLCAVIMVGINGMNVTAEPMEEQKLPAPTGLSAGIKPENGVLYDAYGRYSEIEYAYSIPKEVIDIARNFDNEKYLSAADADIYLQTDYRVDNGSWQYNSAWDTEGTPKYGEYSSDNNAGYYCNSGGYCWYDRIELFDLYGVSPENTHPLSAYCTQKIDGSDSYYNFDEVNHSLEVRTRFFISYYDEDKGEEKVILSEWSSIAGYGKGMSSGYTIPQEQPVAPVLSNPYVTNYEGGADYLCFDVAPQQVFIKMMCAPLEDKGTLADISEEMIYELGTMNEQTNEIAWIEDMSLDASHTYQDISNYSMYYNLMDTEKYSSYFWDGRAVYMRARLKLHVKIDSNNDGEMDNSYWLESPYSNILTFDVPEKGCYRMNIKHGELGDTEHQTDSFLVTEGDVIDYIDCKPLEGCYVDKVMIDGIKRFDVSDAATYLDLDWSTDDDVKYERYCFRFPEGENIAVSSHAIEISYAGTPTAQYDITVSSAANGFIYPSGGTEHIVKVYNKKNQTFEIESEEGFVIDTLLVDGIVVAAAAEQEGYEYTFENVSTNHTIAATYRRTKGIISVNQSSNGTVTTNGNKNAYGNYAIAVGGSLKIDYVPAAGSGGNNYVVEYVEVDGVKLANPGSSYTFSNIQDDHSIYIKFSDTPAVTHNIMVTSSTGGTTSPNGNAAVIEGDSYTVDFFAQEGYSLKQIKVDNKVYTKDQLAGMYYTFTNVQGDHTIYVEFEPVAQDYTVTITKDGSDRNLVTPTGQVKVKAGEGLAINYSAAEYNTVEKILVNNQEREFADNKKGSLTLSNVTADMSVIIKFKFTRPIGDVNGDTVVNLLDAKLTLEAALGVRTLNDEEKKAGDVDYDKEITLKDANLILKAALMIITLK